VFSLVQRKLMESQCGLTFEPHPSPVAAFRLRDLYEETHMQRFLDEYVAAIKGLEPSVGAMYLTSNLILFSSALHYMVACCENAIDFASEHFTAELVYIQGTYSYYTVRFCVNKAAAVPIDTANRERQRNELFAQLYGHTIRPIIELLHRLTGTPKLQMWGSFPQITYTYESLIAQEKDPIRKQRLEADFQYTMKKMPPDAFGTKRNPYHHTYRYVDNPLNPDAPYRMRPTCCMLYRTEGSESCYTCPRLKPKDREERKQQMLKAIGAKKD
jgi:ferric iron reductase protein FhuF